MARGRREARSRRSRLLLRFAIAGGLALLALLYYRPLTTYLDARDALARRTAEVEALERRDRALARELAEASSEAALLREARRLGYVKPGERLYIVKGIAAWRAAARKPKPDH
jgi:cell division protein FtsB